LVSRGGVVNDVDAEREECSIIQNRSRRSRREREREREREKFIDNQIDD